MCEYSTMHSSQLLSPRLPHPVAGEDVPIAYSIFLLNNAMMALFWGWASMLVYSGLGVSGPALFKPSEVDNVARHRCG